MKRNMISCDHIPGLHQANAMQAVFNLEVNFLVDPTSEFVLTPFFMNTPEACATEYYYFGIIQSSPKVRLRRSLRVLLYCHSSVMQIDHVPNWLCPECQLQSGVANDAPTSKKS